MKDRDKCLRRQMLVSYLAMLVLPILVSTALFNMAYRLIEGGELKFHSVLLNNCMREMDRYMRQIDDHLVGISQNTNLKKLMNLPEQPGYISAEASTVHSAYLSLLSTAYAYPSLKADTVIYIHRPDMVFDGNSVIYGQKRFYDMALSYQGMSFEQFKSEILDKYHYKDTYGGVIIEKKKTATRDSAILRGKGFLYVRTLPLIGGRKNSLGTAVVHIDSMANEIMSMVPASANGSTYITDESQNLIFGSFSDNVPEPFGALPLEGNSGTFYHEAGGQRYLASFVKSHYNGWYYISMSPMNQIMSGLYSFQTIAVTVSMSALIIGIIGSLFLSRRNAKPLEEALTELQNAYAKPDANPGSIGKRIRRILEENAGLQKALESQRLMEQSNFFSGLFRGEYANDEDVDTRARYLGIELHATCYCAMTLRYIPPAMQSENDLKTDLAAIVTNNMSLRNAGLRAHSAPLGDRRYGVVLCFDSCDYAANRRAIRAFADLAPKHGLDLAQGTRYYVGGFVTEKSEICISYGEADNIYELHKDDDTGNGVMFYGDLSNNKRGYFYPDEIENKLKHLTTVGDLERLSAILAYIRRENELPAMNKQLAYMLVMAMYATLTEVASELRLAYFPLQIYRLRLSSFNFTSEYERLEAGFLQVAGREDEAEPEIDWARQMEEFVHENISNSELSVTIMSKRFHRSETYFSQYFKRVMGQTFSKYLETLRVNLACSLLKDKEKSIESIAEETGYTNALSFRRAFKKVVGTTPSAFREKGTVSLSQNLS